MKTFRWQESQYELPYELWRIPPWSTFTQVVQFVWYLCPSALVRGERKEYTKGVPLFSTLGECDGVGAIE